MPKSAKHKAQRAADFQKTKLKLGSGKGKAATAKTATDTSFKARTIALPQQSITADKSQAIVTRRNLTLDDLLTQSRHYNASTRKDSLFGLKELLGLHPSLLSKPGVLPAVLAASLRLIPDEDPTVRKAVHTFLSFLLPALRQAQDTASNQGQAPSQHDASASVTALVHYAPSLILYTTSALSHIFTEVRIDALRILDLLLDHIPAAVVSGWDGSARALRLDVGADGHTAASSSSFFPSASRAASESTGQRVITCLLTILGIPDLASFAQQQLTSAGPGSASSALSGVSTATANLPASARLLLFQIIGKFLDACDSSSGHGNLGREQLADVAEQDVACPTWFMRSAFGSTSDREAFEHFLINGLAERASPDAMDEDADERNSHLFAVSSAAYAREGDSLLDVYGQNSAPAWTIADLQAVLASTPDFIHAASELDGDVEQPVPGQKSKFKAGKVYQAPAAYRVQPPSKFSVLASALAPIFLNSVLDATPSLFAPDPVLNTALPSAGGSAVNAGLPLHGLLLRAIIYATLQLWRSLAASLAKTTGGSTTAQRKRIPQARLQELSTLLAKLAPYFPFSEHIPGAHTRSPAEAEQIGEMELGYAELVALCMFCLSGGGGDEEADGTGGPKKQKKKKQAAKGKRKASMREMLLHQLEDVGEYIVETLLGQRSAAGVSGVAPRGGKLAVGADAIVPPLPASTFAELLPTIWLLLNLDGTNDRKRGAGGADSSSDDEDSSDDGGGAEEPDLRIRLIEALVAYFGKATRGKAVIFEFLARLSILHTFPSYTAAFRPLQHPEMLATFRTWFHSLPRALWDAATKRDIRLAGAVLEYLRSVCAADDGEILTHEDIDALHAPLAVFFHLTHPSRGSMPGPYARLPKPAQARAKALLFYLQPLDGKLSSAAAAAGAL